MKRSLNEVTNAFRKAACGAGYPFGVAEDIARAGAALIMAGQDGAATIADILPAEKGLPFSQTALAGAAHFDCAAGGEDRVTLEAVDAPLLLVGFALASARQYGCSFRLTSGDIAFDVTPRGVCEGFSPDYHSGPVSVALLEGQIDVKPLVSGEAPVAGEGVEINEAAWPPINKWSMETCVPASEQSRLSGAGAGLTDND